MNLKTIPSDAGKAACFPIELTEEQRDNVDELIRSARCPRCGSTQIGFMDLGLDSPIQCRDCKEVF